MVWSLSCLQGPYRQMDAMNKMWQEIQLRWTKNYTFIFISLNVWDYLKYPICKRFFQLYRYRENTLPNTQIIHFRDLQKLYFSKQSTPFMICMSTWSITLKLMKMSDIDSWYIATVKIQHISFQSCSMGYELWDINNTDWQDHVVL
jgi:hypothetical protein